MSLLNKNQDVCVRAGNQRVFKAGKVMEARKEMKEASFFSSCD